MRTEHFATVALGMAIAFAAGYVIAKPRPVRTPSPQEISEAQEIANKLLPPVWVRMFRQEPWLKRVRRRGYEYCYRSGSIDPACASEQDEAVQSAFFAILISESQQEMADKSVLSVGELEVAMNPQIRKDVVQYCSRLYADHGKQDARLLAICFGNLPSFSPLVEIPVP